MHHWMNFAEESIRRIVKDETVLGSMFLQIGWSELAFCSWFCFNCFFGRSCADQNTQAFKEVAIIRHPRVGEYAFGFITSTLVLQVMICFLLWCGLNCTKWTKIFNKSVSAIEPHKRMHACLVPFNEFCLGSARTLRNISTKSICSSFH